MAEDDPAGMVAPGDRGGPIGLLGLVAGGGLLLFGVFGSLVPGLKQSIGADFLVFVACVGLAAICGSVGSQARLASGPIIFGGSAAIAAGFFVIWKQLEQPPVEVLYGARLQVISAQKPRKGTIWIDQTEAVAAAEAAQSGKTTTFSFALKQHQAEALERSSCSRLEIDFENRPTETLEFEPRHLVPSKFNQVANLWFDDGASGGRFYHHRRGIPETIKRRCATGAELVEVRAQSEERVPTASTIVRPAAATSVSAPAPVVASVQVPAPTLPSGLLGWSYFGLKPLGESAFSEKNFDIVNRPPGSSPQKGDVLIALTDVRLRQGPRRFNSTTNAWENESIVGVIKAGDKVRLAADPVIANGISYWISSKERVD